MTCRTCTHWIALGQFKADHNGVCVGPHVRGEDCFVTAIEARGVTIRMGSQVVGFGQVVGGDFGCMNYLSKDAKDANGNTEPEGA